MTRRNEQTLHNVQVAGSLDFASVPARLRESSGWFKAHDAGLTRVDLGGVIRADSAGVALLLEWIRDAEQAGAKLQFTNAPAQMRAIIDFCALGDVIPLDR
jgi:phospholipid transport system transporter-binding protein